MVRSTTIAVVVGISEGVIEPAGDGVPVGNGTPGIPGGGTADVGDGPGAVLHADRTASKTIRQAKDRFLRKSLTPYQLCTFVLFRIDFEKWPKRKQTKQNESGKGKKRVFYVCVL